MEGSEGAASDAGRRMDSDEGEQAPVFLLVGVALGAALAFFVALFRRSRPLASAPREPGAEEPWQPEVLPLAQTSPPQTAQRAGSTQWPTATKYVVGVGLLLAVLALLYISRGVIPTLILAALVAFIVSPLVSFFQKRLKLKKGLAVALTYLLVIAVVALVPLILLPAIVNAVNSFLGVDFQSIAERLVQLVQQASAAVAGIPIVNSVVGPLLNSLLESLRAISSAQAPEPISYSLTLSEAGSMLSQIVGRMSRIVGPVVGALTSLAFMILVSLYISLSSEQMGQWYLKLIPPSYIPEVEGLLRRIGRLWGSYLRGQLTLMVVVGMLVWLGNLILGTPNALLLGVVSGFLELVPNIGPTIALIPAVLLALIFGSSHLALSPLAFAVVVLGFYLLVQFAENQFIVPYIMSDAVDLPPLVIIIGTFVGGATGGLLGVLLATPVIATGREVFAYLYNKILEPTPAATPPERPSLFEVVAGGIRGLAGRIKLPVRWQAKSPSPPGETGERGRALAAGGQSTAGVPGGSGFSAADARLHSGLSGASASGGRRPAAEG